MDRRKKAASIPAMLVNRSYVAPFKLVLILPPQKEVPIFLRLTIIYNVNGPWRKYKDKEKVYCTFFDSPNRFVRSDR